MGLEEKIFNKDFKFKVKFINTCILRIRYGHRKERTIRGYKMYVFKMMYTIVIKNIRNFENLIRATPCTEIPTRDEIFTDCYIMFDKCIYKFKVSKTNNFYFYFNKSLSRKFYKDYQKELHTPSVELSDAMSAVHPKLRDNRIPDTMSFLFENLEFSELERRVAISRLNGQRTSEFLKENKDVTSVQYSESLKRIKRLILLLKENGKF